MISYSKYKFYLLLLALIAATACERQEGEKAGKEAEEIKSVRTSMVIRDTLEKSEDFNAYVEAYVKNNIVPQAPNRLSKIYVEVGDQVRKGQLLASFDQAAMTQAQLQMQNAWNDFKRLEELHQIGGISDRDYEAQKTALQLRKSAYDNLSRNTLLRSPIAGVITVRNYDNGDMVGQAPVVVVEQIAPLKMKINISEQFYTAVKKGTPVSLSFDILPDEVFEGKVALVYPTIDPKSRTFTAEVFLANKDKKIRPGMYGKATVSLGKEEMILVPDKAVRTLPGTDETYVFVYRDGTVKRKSVSLAKLYGDYYQLISGLSVGDAVVTAGIHALRDGDTVKVVR